MSSRNAIQKVCALTAAIAGALLCSAVHPALADEQFDVVARKGQITVITKGHWHVNKDYPWRVIVGDKTLDKSKFDFDETSASVSGVPSGIAKLRGAVCEDGQCVPFTKDVAVE